MKVTLVKKPVLPEDVGTIILQPVHASDIDYLKKFGDGEIMQAEVKRDRFYPLTKKYWALCNLTANNHRRDGYECLDTKNTVDEYIKLKLGLIDSRIVFPDGTVHVKTGSISHRAKDKDQFQEYYNQAVEVMSYITEIPARDLELNWMEYETAEGE